ncbi:hypothetical protein [Aurantibacillus circumpalustris]|uniref:hypothetical protein n=1 Tax=Aurantibacillus circumpalustris TaxID=3036359 RepID=UPI00295B9A18|nr:hypothetical protein [Aurantibacillus circumpalustris]
MKKLILLSALAVGLSLTITSCRKQRTCDCQTTSTEVRIGYGEKTTIENSSRITTKEKQTSGDFKYSTDCFSENYDYANSGGNGSSAWSSVTSVQTVCELK